MPCHVYIIENIQGKRYIGQTKYIPGRLLRHNNGLVFSTKNKGSWRLVYQESFSTRSESIKREKEIKKYKGGNALRDILKNYIPR